MGKVKQWAWDEAEKAVDKIILQVKQNLITKETAKKEIMKEIVWKQVCMKCTKKHMV